MPCVIRTYLFRTLAFLALPIAAASAFLMSGTAGAQTGGSPVPGTPWPAVDGLGRQLPLAQQTGGPKTGRFVGIFYFLWHNDPLRKSPHYEGPYDITKILERDPGALQNPASPYWGGIGMSHYWGEPMYGYYRGNDPWILRRHAQLLADAGIDALIFDTTNARSYPDVYMKLLEVYRQVRAEGGRTPQVVFMVNTEAGKTAREIYEALYKPGLFPELWFRWQGKPLMICDPEQASPELKEFFTLRRAHWPFTMTNTPNAWHWEATYPQPYGYTDDPETPEQVNVSVAQNLRQSDRKVTNMSSGEARGRTFHNGRRETGKHAVDWGYNFQEQWKRPFEVSTPFVMVTGWNEWIAGRWGTLDGPLVFVDQFDQEHSRDIEPMKGGHLDHYYWQLVANVRRYKGTPEIPPASAPVKIRVGRDFSAWRAVQPDFVDHAGETLPRKFEGVGGTYYTNTTGRNELDLMKVARDAKHVYFYARTRQSLSPSEEQNWMWLFIDADLNPRTGWAGYDFVINREASWLEVFDGAQPTDWKWKRVRKVNYSSAGNELQLAVRRADLNLPRGTSSVTLDFKWADNLREPGNIMDFYVSGDVAPEGRLNYRYTAE